MRCRFGFDSAFRCHPCRMLVRAKARHGLTVCSSASSARPSLERKCLFLFGVMPVVILSLTAFLVVPADTDSARPVEQILVDHGQLLLRQRTNMVATAPDQGYRGRQRIRPAHSRLSGRGQQRTAMERHCKEAVQQARRARSNVIWSHEHPGGRAHA